MSEPKTQKLKAISIHDSINIPDHILHEVQIISGKLSDLVWSEMQNFSPNISFAAFSFMVPCIIKNMISDDPKEIKRSLEYFIKSVLRNMEVLIEVDLQNKGKNDQ